MDLQFAQDDTVLVTGASRGIGAAITKGFVAEGVSKVHAVSRDHASLSQLSQQIRSEYGVEIHTHALDLTDGAARLQLEETLATVDVLVNNAGAIPAGPLTGADLQQWRSAWDLKVWGYIDLAQLALVHMSERGSGVIINMIGASGERHDASYVAGSVGNAALMAFTRTVGAYSLDHGVRVVGVNPGPVETDRLVGVLRARAGEQWGDAGQWRSLTASYPAGRIATVDQVSDLTVFLASRRAGYISGTIATLDGGMSWRGSIL